MRLLAALLLSLAALLSAAPTSAHEVRPAYLEITARPDGKADVVWKQPRQGEMAVHLEPRLSGGLLNGKPTRTETAENYEIRRWIGVDLKGAGLEGRDVSIAGLDHTITDVLLLVRLKNGDQISRVLTPGASTFAIDAHSGAAVPAYLKLGIVHILTGIDHLLFVFGLILLLILLVARGIRLPSAATSAPPWRRAGTRSAR